MSSWCDLTIEDLGQVITGYTPPIRNTEYFGDEYPFITPTDIALESRIVQTSRFLSQKGFEYRKNRLLPRDAICVTCVGSLGKICMTTVPSATNQQINSVVVNQEQYDPYFVYYLLKTKAAVIESLAGGVATPIVKKSTFASINVFVPPLPTQRKIASILSVYDDLIENNTRRIKILEDIAATIYRQWFVEFRFAGHENVPMVESELGSIPQGWEANFSDYVDFKEGPGLRHWQYRDSGIPFLNIRTLVDNDIDLSKVQYLEEDEVERRYSHFLLEPFDHVVSSSGTIGRIVTIQKNHLPLMLNTSIIRMRANTQSVGVWQLRHFLKSDYFQYQIHTLATGTAQKNYGPSHLKQMKIIAPDFRIGRNYEAIVAPMEELIGQLVMKNQNLRQTRDLLLPKLISGELDVSELDINSNGLLP